MAPGLGELVPCISVSETVNTAVAGALCLVPYTSGIGAKQTVDTGSVLSRVAPTRTAPAMAVDSRTC